MVQPRTYSVQLNQPDHAENPLYQDFIIIYFEQYMAVLSIEAENPQEAFSYSTFMEILK